MKRKTSKKYQSKASLRTVHHAAATNCRPFLKWAGGKSQLLDELHSRLPARFGRYFEPFVGGGALLFKLQPKKAYISDVNPELINLYEVVRDRVEQLIEDLKQHRHRKDYYYKVRAWDRQTSYKKIAATKRASRLIFLNKTCYNGLYRVNSKGQFNVPFGDYLNPKILDESNLLACSRVLREVSIEKSSYLEIRKHVRSGDFVYFDPPYAPLSSTSNFTSYSSNRFSQQDQIELSQLCRALDKRGVLFMLSNSSAPLIKKLYADFNLQYVSASRAINSKGARRGKVKEVIVTNY